MAKLQCAREKGQDIVLKTIGHAAKVKNILIQHGSGAFVAQRARTALSATPFTVGKSTNIGGFFGLSDHAAATAKVARGRKPSVLASSGVFTASTVMAAGAGGAYLCRQTDFPLGARVAEIGWIEPCAYRTSVWGASPAQFSIVEIMQLWLYLR